MTLTVKIMENRYVDSVSLMALSTRANELDGVNEVIVAMATDMNKEVMENVHLFNEEIKQAKSSDLVIAMTVENAEQSDSLFEQIEQMMNEKKTITQGQSEQVFSTIDTAVEANPEANLALISVNGLFAAREARKALEKNLHVMMFSDNVAVEEEISLKQFAHERGLFMMGPDCGTAIINNKGLGFANKVRSGSIGIIGASGTGSQELSVRIHEFGGGISQLIGTGGRDLSQAVGGLMMLDAMDELEKDEQTKVIALISKPPAKEVEKKIIDKAKMMSKPVVVWFVGSEKESQEENVYFEKYSKNAALKAVELAGIDLSTLNLHPLNWPLIQKVRESFGSEKKYIRGLFAGGTLCAEALTIAEETLADVYSNISHEPEKQPDDLFHSKGHTFIDFGADEYTNGKPHPMIDPSNRIERFRKEARDPEVGVIILDFVLGFGAHPDPVGMMVDEIKQAKEQARKEGRALEILGYVLGTELDEQVLTKQIDQLIEAGGIYASSSQNTGLLAREFVGKGEHHE